MSAFGNGYFNASFILPNFLTFSNFNTVINQLNKRNEFINKLKQINKTKRNFKDLIQHLKDFNYNIQYIKNCREEEQNKIKYNNVIKQYNEFKEKAQENIFKSSWCVDLDFIITRNTKINILFNNRHKIYNRWLKKERARNLMSFRGTETNNKFRLVLSKIKILFDKAFMKKQKQIFLNYIEPEQLPHDLENLIFKTMFNINDFSKIETINEQIKKNKHIKLMNLIYKCNYKEFIQKEFHNKLLYKMKYENINFYSQKINLSYSLKEILQNNLNIQQYKKIETGSANDFYDIPW